MVLNLATRKSKRCVRFGRAPGVMKFIQLDTVHFSFSLSLIAFLCPKGGFVDNKFAVGTTLIKILI